MPTNDKIIEAELKELFEWIGTLNYDVNRAISKTSTPSPTEKDAIRTACKKIAEKVRVDSDIRKTIRKAVANYIQSEGCSCCSNIEEHGKAKKKLAKLLNVPKYGDDSGYNFSKFATKR